MRPSLWWLPFGLLALALLACNQILETRKGTLASEAPVSETSSTQPPEADDETATTPTGSIGAAESNDQEAAPTTDVASDASDAAANCEHSSRTAKACGALCVSVDDPLHGCGAADCSPCAVTGAVAACVNGGCSIAVCTAGRADCNADATDGCEADLNAPTSCGACGVVCPPRAHAVPACTSLACAFACAPGWGNCNDDPVDGCETNLAKDTANCGRCGNKCVIGRCAGGGCTLL